MPLSVLAGATVAPPPAPTGDVIVLRQPITGTVTLLFPWAVMATNPTITTAVDESSRITGAVL